MRLVEHGYCTYHNRVVTENLCAYKDQRCLTCDLLIPKEKYVTVEEASEMLGKSPATIRSWIRKGKLEADWWEFINKYPRRTYRYKAYFIKRESLENLMQPRLKETTLRY